MTQIGSLTVTTPAKCDRRGYEVSMLGSTGDYLGFIQLRELFAKSEYGTAVHEVPGTRPHGEDLTDELVNTQYVIFTHGTTGKPQDGYYLLRPSYTYTDDESPEGHSYVFSLNLFFLGTISYYSHAYRVKLVEREAECDWSI